MTINKKFRQDVPRFRGDRDPACRSISVEGYPDTIFLISWQMTEDATTHSWRRVRKQNLIQIYQRCFPKEVSWFDIFDLMAITEFYDSHYPETQVRSLKIYCRSISDYSPERERESNLDTGFFFFFILLAIIEYTCQDLHPPKGMFWQDERFYCRSIGDVPGGVSSPKQDPE